MVWETANIKSGAVGHDMTRKTCERVEKGVMTAMLRPRLYGSKQRTRDKEKDDIPELTPVVYLWY